MVKSESSSSGWWAKYNGSPFPSSSFPFVPYANRVYSCKSIHKDVVRLCPVSVVRERLFKMEKKGENVWEPLLTKLLQKKTSIWPQDLGQSSWSVSLFMAQQRCWGNIFFSKSRVLELQPQDHWRQFLSCLLCFRRYWECHEKPTTLYLALAYIKITNCLLSR